MTSTCCSPWTAAICATCSGWRLEEACARVKLLREFDPSSGGGGDLDVPDPYYGGPRGFEDVLDMVHAACLGLLAEVRGGGVL